jgi:hypothetical protein
MTIRALIYAALAIITVGCGSPERPPAAQPATQGAGQPARTPQQAPQWPTAASVDQTALGAMSADASGQVGESPVPVLVPTDRQILAASRVSIGASHYTLASSTNGLTVSVQASSTPKESPASAGPSPAGLAPPGQFKAGDRQVSITENEGIRVATWFENGVAYSADVECATTTDARCKDNTYLLSLVRDLVFAGGRPR